MKISRDVDSEEDKAFRLMSRLAFVESELECPDWMLGQVYKSKLMTEKSRLIRRLDKSKDLGYAYF